MKVELENLGGAEKKEKNKCYIIRDVRVTDIDVPFFSMIIFMIKLVFASIPAIIIVLIITIIVNLTLLGAITNLFASGKTKEFQRAFHERKDIKQNIYTEKKSNIKKFYNEYRGIVPGKSTYSDIYSVLGQPLSVVNNGNNVKYIFEKVEVTIQNETQQVNTIIINKDNDYMDKNGVMLGDSKINFDRKTKKKIGDKHVTGDCRHGYNYWFKDGKVEKIVLGHEMRCR